MTEEAVFTVVTLGNGGVCIVTDREHGAIVTNAISYGMGATEQLRDDGLVSAQAWEHVEETFNPLARSIKDELEQEQMRNS